MLASKLRALLVIILLGCVCLACIPTTPAPPDPPIEEIVSKPDYMKECLEINPIKQKDQAGFDGIFPGRTPTEDVVREFGNPRQSHFESDDSKWDQYEDFSVVSKSNVVIRLHVYYDDQGTTTLLEYIERHGCPDAIFKTEPGEEHSGSISFIYNRIGFGMIFFTAGKVRLTDKPDGIFYFPLAGLEEYISSDEFLSDPAFARPIPWRKAVSE